MADAANVFVVSGPEIAAYGFPGGHPFGPDRHDAFVAELGRSPRLGAVAALAPMRASAEQLEWFHTHEYVERVRRQSSTGEGMLDLGDTPAYRGVFEAASFVVGSVLSLLRRIVAGPITRGFVPIAGLHHARRDAAAGFCVFNDCGVAIEAARREHGLRRVAYVDIDAHHGDGVYYGFEDDPGVIIADIHEDGRFLYPGTGSREERGKGAAVGTKLNLPLPSGAGDAHFFRAWEEVEACVDAGEPELVILQCGADSLGGDPITHLAFTEEAHAHAATRLRVVADRHARGRLIALGGGGYDRNNLARAWTRVVEALA
jgi:acetoin utilization protein AcuC